MATAAQLAWVILRWFSSAEGPATFVDGKTNLTHRGQEQLRAIPKSWMTLRYSLPLRSDLILFRDRCLARD
jgi:hypothetical protein